MLPCVEGSIQCFLDWEGRRVIHQVSLTPEAPVFIVFKLDNNDSGATSWFEFPLVAGFLWNLTLLLSILLLNDKVTHLYISICMLDNYINEVFYRK